MYKIILPLLTFFVFSYSHCFAQNPIDITEQTIRLGGLKEEILYFGFAAGDKIIFNFHEMENKELKEVEIIEYPSNSKFSDYKTVQIIDKSLSVSQQGVYAFRFKNSAMTGRICKIKIQRIPAGEHTINFNSNVFWEVKQDTSYNSYTKNVIVGYDTLHIQKTKKELVKSELSEEMLMDRVERVHSQTNLGNSNYTTIKITLPQNEITSYKTKNIVSWLYWIGVNKEASEAWAKNVHAIKNLASGVAMISGGGPLAGLAVGAIGDLAKPTMGEDVSYWFITDYTNEQLFKSGEAFLQFDSGKGIASFGKHTTFPKDPFYIGLLNDNMLQGIDVAVKVSVIWETKNYEDKIYTDMSVTPRYEKQIFSDPIITTTKVPVTGK